MPRYKIEFLTDEEQKCLIEVFNIRYFNSVRNKLIILFFLNYGLTLSELINLKWSDIGIKTTVIRKNKLDSRIIDLDKNKNLFFEIVGKWKDIQYYELGLCEYVFTTRTKKQLDEKYLRRMILTYSRKAKISKDVTPQMLRHTYAVDLLKSTKDLSLLQRSLGHKNIETTKKYLFVLKDI